MSIPATRTTTKTSKVDWGLSFSNPFTRTALAMPLLDDDDTEQR